ncbi:4674_t:CDS:2 [Acaulospora colombiana]|uniref:4674_t:CDS:1 n=1 Tax=Acaulospora colombiana TaxID=27376 RepID=A0ACA9PW58_9GLOM|nr:4674_t:CDS:2 [Acaulospora colombiana]
MAHRPSISPTLLNSKPSCQLGVDSYFSPCELEKMSAALSDLLIVSFDSTVKTSLLFDPHLNGDLATPAEKIITWTPLAT